MIFMRNEITLRALPSPMMGIVIHSDCTADQAVIRFFNLCGSETCGGSESGKRGFH